MKRLFYGILIVVVLSIGIGLFVFNKPPDTNCTKEVEYFFSEFPGYFESFDKGVEWCNECVDKNGIPRWSPTGPFCALKTSDGGKICTDSSQCEGICLAENENSKFGKCSDIDAGIGCVFEMHSGKALEVCYD